MSQNQVVIYSDGGADPNPGIGGWAAVLRYGEHEKVLTGHDPQTTNSRMELQAALAALQALKRPSTVTFHTDSEYLRRGITEWAEKWAAKGWQKEGKPTPNADLWQQLLPLVKQHQIEWHWVKGHSGDPMNERVDQLARQARLEITPKVQLSPNIPRLYLRASCQGNPGPGGWGVVMETGEETRQASGSELKTTNNRMEIAAAIAAIQLLPPNAAAQLFTTSDYLFQGATQWLHGWRKRAWHKKDGQPIANHDLWQQLDQLLASRSIYWINAKGEEGKQLIGLQEAGKLAVQASQSG
ncbi:MAG: ribonuclease HI [Anaerolineae bacterium]|nr:ribonuclease HI [Anaerolineae bacterium]